MYLITYEYIFYILAGREILVGLTTRTNELGIRALHRNFPKYPVRMVDLAKLLEASTGEVYAPSGEKTACVFMHWLYLLNLVG